MNDLLLGHRRTAARVVLGPVVLAEVLSHVTLRQFTCKSAFLSYARPLSMSTSPQKACRELCTYRTAALAMTTL